MNKLEIVSILLCFAGFVLPLLGYVVPSPITTYGPFINYLSLGGICLEVCAALYEYSKGGKGK